MTMLAEQDGSPLAAAAAARQLDQPAFISLLDPEQVRELAVSAPDGPLRGVPVALKDNLDLVGVPTTGACPSRDSPATATAAPVQRLIDAGAVPIGKTNMDQFATGLVGTRSPYGACHSVGDPARISGGSSSGSAVAVAAGVVPLALGTDTAGSGRVPAAFNGLVGVKPTRGLISTRGLLPACRSLDCVTTLTRTVEDARTALGVLVGYDAEDPRSRPLPAALPPGVASVFTTLGVPSHRLDLDEEHGPRWAAAVQHARQLGLDLVDIDLAPFLETAQLLYEGPWVAERYAAVGEWIDADGPGLDPTVRSIIAAGARFSAVDAFRGMDRLAQLRRRTEPVWQHVDALLLPVTPGHPTLAEVAAAPVAVNSRLGTYTNFANLLDLSVVAVPAPPPRLGAPPFGVQLVAPALADRPLLELASLWCGEGRTVTHARPEGVTVVVAGAHMSGLPLNHLLTGRGGRFLRRARTAAGYRMTRVPAPGVPRPALVPGDGPPDGFPVEVWELPGQAVGALANELSAPLCLGTVHLADGSSHLGYVGGATGLSDGLDISASGGWRGYLRTVAPLSPH